MLYLAKHSCTQPVWGLLYTFLGVKNVLKYPLIGQIQLSYCIIYHLLLMFRNIFFLIWKTSTFHFLMMQNHFLDISVPWVEFEAGRNAICSQLIMNCKLQQWRVSFINANSFPSIRLFLFLTTFILLNSCTPILSIVTNKPDKV